MLRSCSLNFFPILLRDGFCVLFLENSTNGVARVTALCILPMLTGLLPSKMPQKRALQDAFWVLWAPIGGCNKGTKKQSETFPRFRTYYSHTIYLNIDDINKFVKLNWLAEREHFRKSTSSNQTKFNHTKPNSSIPN